MMTPVSASVLVVGKSGGDSPRGLWQTWSNCTYELWFVLELVTLQCSSSATWGIVVEAKELLLILILNFLLGDRWPFNSPPLEKLSSSLNFIWFQNSKPTCSLFIMESELRFVLIPTVWNVNVFMVIESVCMHGDIKPIMAPD